MGTHLLHPDTLTANPGPDAPPGAVAIPLTQGLYAWVDETDMALVSGFKWYAKYIAEGKVYYAYHSLNPGSLLMHREILDTPDDLVTDHIGGPVSTLDNRRSNLRIATIAQNGHNTGPKRTNTSGYCGVSRVGSRWRATIRRSGQWRNLGRFDTAEEAAHAYDRAAQEMHGAFAKTNESLGLV